MKDATLFSRFFLIAGIALLLYALGLYFTIPAARLLWIWPAAPALGLAFAGAWLAAGALHLLWVGVTGHLTAIRGLALGGFIAYAGTAARLITQFALPGHERYLLSAAIFAFGALLSGVVVALLYRRPSAGDRDIPGPIRWAFLVFSAILLPVGVAMVLGAPHVYPVTLSPDMIVIYGCFFLGSFGYYFYGFLKPSLFNATGHMLAFLIYDLMLIPPFVAYWPVVAPEFKTSLLVYLIILVASAVFCAYYLLVNPKTRLFQARPATS